MARIVSIKTDEKSVVHIVTLSIVDRNVPGRTQVLRHPITKVVMLVGNNESPNRMFKIGSNLGEQDETARDKLCE